ncbi:MAG: hypothetical protein RBQ97_06400 [Acholeplasma sp.]|nr:hypothetical protein [Acholeplasma sp.]
MKYYENLSLLQVFNKYDLDLITDDDNKSKQILKTYIDKNIIKKISYDYYGTIDFSTRDLYADKFVIGSKVNKDAFISHRSAFEFHGFYNQVYNEVYVSSLKTFKSFDFDDISYIYVKTNNFMQVETIKNTKVSSIERTIVDSIKDVDKISDIEETLKCIDLISYIDENKIMNYLDSVNNKTLYKKTGYILSIFRENLKLTNEFFDELKEKGGKVRGYFSQINKHDLTYQNEWGIYAYEKEYLHGILNKKMGK